MRLFFTTRELAEHDETVAEALLATEAMVQEWRPPRGTIDHLRSQHGIRPENASLYLLGCFFKTVARVERMSPVLVPESQNDLLVYLTLLKGEGIVPWNEPIPDLHTFLNQATQSVMAKAVLASAARLKSAMDILVRSGCESLEDAECIAKASETYWLPILDAMPQHPPR